ncbi:NAD-glutamate dehydrogenase domain-containing protein [Desulfatitalea alkaliphila]|uniref:NAD-glutamate dehydrogenase n=1 Tax=Desulfatitalea alkaliphila TaxID=2929485 RepID=A0AA41R5P3_9BACT|nr:NAD-glutamate dehydrogenase domain-containing protein [Desulfatitalea alkaliphila]MCJ8501515.1 NAD-glutamate dehydrogenase [Desulfatitalea alkaliphila]
MESTECKDTIPSKGAHITTRAKALNLDPGLLYEAVVDLAAEGLLTANCLNLAAGILLEELGLPAYFFENIDKGSLKHILGAIAANLAFKENKPVLSGRVAHIDFDLAQKDNVQKVRIATRETRDAMEKMLEKTISGHRREYYYCPDYGYYTYIIRPETVRDYSREAFDGSRFLFSLAGDYLATPEPTRQRYKAFLHACEQAVCPLITVSRVPETDETRLMFNSDFAVPQLPVFRKLIEDHGRVLMRAYWEPYLGSSATPSSICSLYLAGSLGAEEESALTRDLAAFLALAVNPISQCYLDGRLTFEEMLFAINAVDFTHMFIYKERDNATDREILAGLDTKDHMEAFAARIHGANKSTYTRKVILEAVTSHPDLVKTLHDLFARRHRPGHPGPIDAAALETQAAAFERALAARFMDNGVFGDIFRFMVKLVACTLKTNFYKPGKRSFAFRCDNRILDPLVFDQFVFGIFFVNGHYARGTHMRAGDIARGGLRLIRVSDATHPAEIDNAVLLNYALGPKAQRLKHKDICESGAKGVVVPHADYSTLGRQALLDYTEGILDLVLGDAAIVDHHGRPEMIFFGPDEGTAGLMDAVARRARDRGYRHWRTLTTGKSIGIPHDTYGMLNNGDLFGLFDRQEQGTELQINGKTVAVTTDMAGLFTHIGGRIETSGMTTTGVMAAFRSLVEHHGARQEALNLMMTGGPDGDLGANEIQCYKGKICLVIDGGGVLFDPDGLDQEALTRIAFMRHSAPRANTLHYPADKLGPRGFLVPAAARDVTLPDGTVVENGALFHRTFLSTPENRRFIRQADIRAFIPCGGFKDTINRGNVKPFLSVFQELQFIVEGANVFFDDAARRYIAAATGIKQIKDTTANKGGVYSSAIAEVLTAFLLGDDYEAALIDDTDTRWALIRDVMTRVAHNARLETGMLLRIHAADPTVPLFTLSETTSEQIFDLQHTFEQHLETILQDMHTVRQVMEKYIPAALVTRLGIATILEKLDTNDLRPYRDAIITKKLASMAFYRFGDQWPAFLERLTADFSAGLQSIVAAE